MKVCHIVPSLEERHGGPSKSVLATCEALAHAGHDVELFTTATDAPSAGATERIGEVTVRRFRRRFPQSLYVAPAMQAALINADADIIHHHALWVRTLKYAQVAAKASKVPLVISPRGMMSEWAWQHHRRRKAIARALVHPDAFEAAAGWHATSEQEAQEIYRLGFNRPACVAANGVSMPTEEERLQSQAFWGAHCASTATMRTALYYGRFHQKKRVLELIDAWLERAPSDWLLLLVGIPEEYTVEMLEAYALRQSSAGRVRAYSGMGTPPPYAACELFLLPSHNENFGLTVAEAMAWGLPVVVTDTMPWTGVNERQCGWCVPWAHFGDAIQSATQETPTQLKARGITAQNWMSHEYTWASTAAQLEAFYLNLRR